MLQVIDKHSADVGYFTGEAVRNVALSTAITSKEQHHAPLSGIGVCPLSSSWLLLFLCVVVVIIIKNYNK